MSCGRVGGRIGAVMGESSYDRLGECRLQSGLGSQVLLW